MARPHAYQPTGSPQRRQGNADNQCFFFSSRRRHTRFKCDWSSDVCSSDLRSSPGAAAKSDSFVEIWRFIALPSTCLRLQAGPIGHIDLDLSSCRENRLSDANCQIGRASCRERVEISVVAVSLKKKKKVGQR